MLASFKHMELLKGRTKLLCFLVYRIIQKFTKQTENRPHTKKLVLVSLYQTFSCEIIYGWGPSATDEEPFDSEVSIAGATNTLDIVIFLCLSQQNNNGALLHPAKVMLLAVLEVHLYRSNQPLKHFKLLSDLQPWHEGSYHVNSSSKQHLFWAFRRALTRCLALFFGCQEVQFASKCFEWPLFPLLFTFTKADHCSISLLIALKVKFRTRFCHYCQFWTAVGFRGLKWEGLGVY